MKKTTKSAQIPPTMPDPEKLIEEIEIVYHHENRVGQVGIGFWQNKLVEFELNDRFPSMMIYGTWKKEITLQESLDWLLKMDFALERLGECLSEGHSWREWLEQLKTKV